MVLGHLAEEAGNAHAISDRCKESSPSVTIYIRARGVLIFDRGVHGQKEKARSAFASGPFVRALRGDPVDRAALLVLLGVDLEAELLAEGAGHGAAHRVRLPAEPLGRASVMLMPLAVRMASIEGLLRLLARRRLGSPWPSPATACLGLGLRRRCLAFALRGFAALAAFCLRYSPSSWPR